MYKLHPLPSRIIMQEDSFDYGGRIIIPDQAKRRPTTGTITSVGSAIKNVKVGDRVVVPIFSGTGLRFRDPKTQAELPPIRVITEDEILAILDGDAELIEAGA